MDYKTIDNTVGYCTDRSNILPSYDNALDLFQENFLITQSENMGTVYDGPVTNLAQRLDISRRQLIRFEKQYPLFENVLKRNYFQAEDKVSLDLFPNYENITKIKGGIDDLLGKPEQFTDMVKDMPLTESLATKAVYLGMQEITYKEAKQEFNKHYLTQAFLKYGDDLEKFEEITGRSYETMSRKARDLGLDAAKLDDYRNNTDDDNREQTTDTSLSEEHMEFLKSQIEQDKEEKPKTSSEELIDLMEKQIISEKIPKDDRWAT